MEPLPENQPKTRRKRKNIVRQDNNSPQYVREKMASAEMTKKRLEGLAKWRAANPGKWGRQKGHPDGIRLKDWLIVKEKVAKKAERAVEIMAEKDIWIPDNDIAAKAMKAAIEVLEAPGEHRNKLASAKVILDFVQTRPVTKNETTLKSAEEFLSSLVDDDKE